MEKVFIKQENMLATSWVSKKVTEHAREKTRSVAELMFVWFTDIHCLDKVELIKTRSAESKTHLCKT